MTQATLETPMSETDSPGEKLKLVRKNYRSYQRAQERVRLSRLELQASIRDARQAGLTLSAIGDQMGISPQRVGQILDAA